jgi:hypothetical protein
MLFAGANTEADTRTAVARHVLDGVFSEEA